MPASPEKGWQVDYIAINNLDSLSELDTMYQMWPHQGRLEGEENLPDWLVYL